MQDKLKQQLAHLFEGWAGEAPKKITPIQAHGSERKYYRIFASDGRTAIAAHNADRRENIAFLTFSRHFRNAGLPVPEIYAEDLDHGLYLEEDLGDTTLFSLLSDLREKEGFSGQIVQLYEKVVDLLPQFQVAAARDLDYTVCYPRARFDKQSMMWDLNYFKYYFLKLAKIPFDEQYLEDDFQRFTDFLLQADGDFFLYRDFQSRNIMIRDGQPFFIDYQGGRKGALQYDIASLLFDAKADIPQEVRDALLDRYIEAVSKLLPIDRDSFLQYYYGYVFIRIMQALGAYGFRGFYERKTHFLRSVPYAIRNLEWLLRTADLPVELPALTDAWERLVRSSYLRQISDANLRLRVRIQSFSYRRGIPVDEKGHGGGFVFDCRALPNPGRFPEYAEVTGNDPEVIEFLEKEEEVHRFLAHTNSILDQVVANYQKRNFTDLMVAFGCTGGQHRSVYCANRVADYLRRKYDIDIEVRHRELEMK
jgi:aminoglycoside/choline kinase family phosphotransferase